MNTNKSLFECSTLPTVALPFMNTVHCEELELVAGLMDALVQQVPDAQLDTRLADWVAHTEAHFAREERLMREYNFFAYPMHQGEHEQALQQLRAVQGQWLASPNRDLLEGYIRHWREWLQQHISSMDFVTAHYLSQFNPQVEP